MPVVSDGSFWATQQRFISKQNLKAKRHNVEREEAERAFLYATGNWETTETTECRQLSACPPSESQLAEESQRPESNGHVARAGKFLNVERGLGYHTGQSLHLVEKALGEG